MSCAIAGYTPGSQLKHGEVLVIMMEVGLFEQIPPSWQEEGNRYQKLTEDPGTTGAEAKMEPPR